jgi:hypothetical protein
MSTLSHPVRLLRLRARVKIVFETQMLHSRAPIPGIAESPFA